MNSNFIATLSRFLILFLLMVAYSHTGLSYNLDKIDTRLGLSNNFVLCITQDKKGIIWVGTESGLNRFDGNKFKKVELFDEKGNPIASGINKILADKEGDVLWIATSGGNFGKFDCRTLTFKIYHIAGAEESNPTDNITDICFDGAGNIWIATYNSGLKKFDKSSGFIVDVALHHPLLPKDYRLRSIHDDLNGKLYIGHWGNGFSILSIADNTLKHFVHETDNLASLPGNEVLDICIDYKENIWLATHWGVALFHPETETFTVFKHQLDNPSGLTDSDVHTLCEIDKKLWIGTWRGGVNILDLATLNISDPSTLKCDYITTDDSFMGLSSLSITDIFRDRYGNIWIGTNGEGINVIGYTEPYFKSIPYKPITLHDINSLSHKIVTSISKDPKDRIWVGYDNGIVDIFYKKKNEQYYSKIDKIHLGGGITAISADSKDNIWFGVDKVGVLRYNTKKKELNKITKNENNYFPTYVFDICEDNESNVWIATNDGLLKYHAKSGQLQEINGDRIQTPNNLIRYLCEDNNGNIWVCSKIDGISVITQQGGLIKKINLHSNVNSIYKDSRNRIWVATNNGLLFFENIPNDYSYKTINKLNGIPENYIQSVIEGETGEMWLTTSAGISKYTLKDDAVENYNYYDGVYKKSFRVNAAAKLSDGTVFFGAQDALCYFNAGQIFWKKKSPPVIITNFSIYDPETHLGNTVDLPVMDNVELNYNQNTFTVDFNISDYAFKDEIEFAYSLQGNDDIWYDTKGQNQLTFTNLAPGNYMLNIKSKLRNQKWSDDITTLNIIIRPPLWLTLWAKMIYIILGIIIVIVIIRFYKRRLDLENQLYFEKQSHIQEQNLIDEKLRFYTNITHELRTPLTLILGPLEDLSTNRQLEDDVAKKISFIHKSARRLHTLINQILEFRKSETSNKVLNLSYGNISTLINEVVLKYKELNQNINVSINFIIENNPQVFYDKEVITVILDNIISNALKFTVEGHISVFLRESDKEGESYTEIEITDSGMGIAAEESERIFERYYQAKSNNHTPGTGIGLALVKNMVILHQGTIHLKSELEKGTSFFVRIKTNNTYPESIHLEETAGKDIGLDATPILLVVEDNNDIREYIKYSFADSFEVLTSENGKRGLEIATERIPDIIISDIMMPVMDGIELCRTLKEDIRTSHIPIILLTAKDSEKDKTEGYFTGADSYITKPFSANLIKTRIANLLDGRKKIADYFSTNTYKKIISSNSLSKLDNEFVEKLISIIEDNIQMEQINVSFLTNQLNMSYSTFYRKLKALTGMNANELIRKVKMQHAEKLLLSHKYTVLEVMHQVGYSSRTYFREAFKTEFGVLPSKYLNNLKDDCE